MTNDWNDSHLHHQHHNHHSHLFLIQFCIFGIALDDWPLAGPRTLLPRHLTNLYPKLSRKILFRGFGVVGRRSLLVPVVNSSNPVVGENFVMNIVTANCWNDDYRLKEAENDTLFSLRLKRIVVTPLRQSGSTVMTSLDQNVESTVHIPFLYLSAYFSAKYS